MTQIILLIFWLLNARIPEPLWVEYIAVAQCESHLNPTAVGDGGNSKGLMQIQYHLWLEWALTQDRTFKGNQWDNPIDNLRLAYFIQEGYSIPRHKDRWDQWTAKPTFDCGKLGIDKSRISW